MPPRCLNLNSGNGEGRTERGRGVGTKARLILQELNPAEGNYPGSLKLTVTYVWNSIALPLIVYGRKRHNLTASKAARPSTK